MKPRYKNKRDFYKAETERLAQQVEFWKKESTEKQELINKLSKPVKKERIEVAWFCPQCRVVAKGSAIRGFNIEGSDCLNCGKKGIMAVAKLPQHFG